MPAASNGLIGFACSYVPLPVIHAAGYTPWRILPTGDNPDQAGQLLHDNLCPHVKCIVDRVLANDLPDLEGTVFVNSCDAMRRMADAWQAIRPHDKTIMLDLPATREASALKYFAEEMRRLGQTLGEWRGNPLREEALQTSIERYHCLTRRLGRAQEALRTGTLEGGRARLQTYYNQASQEPVETVLKRLETVLTAAPPPPKSLPGVPIFLFGNVLPDPAVFEFFETCGALIAGDDLCTGSRLFTEEPATIRDDIWLALARERFMHAPCARTFDPGRPGEIAHNVLSQAQACHARGVIGYTLKFCDPYLARMPLVRSTLRDNGLPVLVLEGDCTLRSIGQQQTRIEAFVEMLREAK